MSEYLNSRRVDEIVIPPEKETYSITEANLGEGGRGGERHALLPIFCNHLYFAIILKNYKLRYFKLN